jgi:hypothetical protein
MVTVKMGARCLGGLIDREALDYQHVGDDAAKTAAVAAVSTKGGHWGTLVIIDGKMTRR